MAAVIRQVREAAANEAERFLVQAAAELKASPACLCPACAAGAAGRRHGRQAQLGAVEKEVRDGVLGIGAAIVAGAMRLWGTGYAGSRKMCACGETQKYMNDRERRVVSLLGGFRFKRAYYWCAACGESDAPMDRALEIGRSDIWVSKRKRREISEAIGASMMPAEETAA